MNSLFSLLGIEAWKPVLTALVLPPVPLLLGVLLGARLILPRRGWGWLIVAVSVSLLWLTACTGTAQLMTQFMTQVPPVISRERIDALKVEATARPQFAIVVLGGGMEPHAPEYGVSSLSERSLERLRYGVWLSRQTGIPLAFSGGTGWGQLGQTPEAQIAAQIAAKEFMRPLKWIEDDSRDTRENAARTMALLKPAGIKHVLLVTHASHMARATRAFEQAAADHARIEPAPLGLSRRGEPTVLAWLPSSPGFAAVRNVLRELLGQWMGA